jgi:hypothetical protein
MTNSLVRIALSRRRHARDPVASVAPPIDARSAGFKSNPLFGSLIGLSFRPWDTNTPAESDGEGCIDEVHVSRNPIDLSAVADTQRELICATARCIVRPPL